jgi:two-component system OmpR family sensor kinase
MTDAPPAVRRRSLKARLVVWMLLSTTISLSTFAVAVYGLVRAEIHESLSSEPASAESGGALDDPGEEVLFAMLLAAPLCLAVAIGGSVWLGRRALSPVDAVIREASELGARDLHRRLALPKDNDELRDLVVALNGLLARLDEGFAALGRYAADASHELRTPLAVISTELEVALRRPREREEWERVARTSLDELRHLTRLVEALLELSRAGAEPSPSVASFTLEECVQRAIGPLQATASDQDVTLVAEPLERALWVRGSAELLTSAIRELVSNALRFSPRGCAVRVRTERRASGAVDVHIDDAGPGVAAEERLAIFAPFARGAASPAPTATRRSGAGLGLAIAARSVQRCGGHIEVSTSPEGGARFTVSLPSAEPT